MSARDTSALLPDGSEHEAGTPGLPAGALRDTIANGIEEAHMEWMRPGSPSGQRPLCGVLADAVLAIAEAELRRVSALHADTERRLRADLAAEVQKREAADAAARRVEDALAGLEADADHYDATGQTKLLHTASGYRGAISRVRTALDAPEETEPMPTCTATITGPNAPGDEPVHCTRPAGHGGHHAGMEADYGKLLWTDHHAGATPHMIPPGCQPGDCCGDPTAHTKET